MAMNGAILTLIRERRPLAALAILALLLPALLSARGLHVPLALATADGAGVICTGSGFARLVDPAAVPGRPDAAPDTGCCAAGCLHAGPTGLLAAAPAHARPDLIATADPGRAPAQPAPGTNAGGPGPIRAPPVRPF